MASLASTSRSPTTNNPDDESLLTSGANEDVDAAECSDTRLLTKVRQKKLSSLSSRQRKMGPAPLASFEDLSMDKTTSDSSSADERNTLVGIGEASEPISPLSPSIKIAALTVPTSPRIRVSAASTSSAHDTDSKDSTPDKELFIGYTKKDYCEEMSDVKTSTEELLAEEERLRRAREKAKKAETEKYEEALRISKFDRKESSSSVLSENLLPVISSHSSRLSSLGSTGSHVRRSPSPHRMLLETSFCGNKPILQPSIDLEDPPMTTNKLLDYAMDNLESIVSPTDDREFSESPTLIPFNSSDASQTPSSVTTSTKSLTSDSGAPKKSQFQERRDKIDQELTRIHQSSPRNTPERGSGTSENRPRAIENQMSSSEATHKRKESSESPNSSKSPRLGKKVLPPHIPDLKDLRKTGVAPVPPPPPPLYGETSATILSDSARKQSISTTPTASPKFGKKYIGKKNKENAGPGSGNSTPSTSRKSSFSSLFRRGDAALSPVTPDSPGSATGRKSPFSELIKSARNEYRSRSRSRSRSKSRDREFDDESLERKTVLSIFKPKSKRKDDPTSKGDEERVEEKSKSSSEAIMKIEFTFNSNKEFSPPGSDRSEVTDDDPFAPKTARGSGPKSPQADKQMKSNVDVLKDHETEPKPHVRAASPYKSVIEDLEQRQKEIAEKAAAKAEEKQDTVLEVENSAQVIPKTEEVIAEAPKQEELKVKIPPEEDSISESERESEIDYLKKKQQLGIEDDHTVSSDVEIKKLVGHDNGEEDELPYVPTTLPLERSQVTPMVPVKERASSLKMVQSIERPRSATPIHPCRLEQFKQSIDQQGSELETEKINIKIPKKTIPAKNVVRQSSKSWEDFCQEGLKSPRTLRRERRENSLHGNEINFAAVTKQRTRSEGKSPSSRETTPLEAPKSWINFEEIPDINMKPVKQIKTLQQQKPLPQPSGTSEPHRKPKLTQQMRADASKMNDSYHPDDLSSPRKKLDSQLSEDILPASLRSLTSTPDRDDSSEKSSDSERLGSQSSSEELTTIREKIAEIKKREDKANHDESSDLERLLAPVNDCIAKLSTISTQNKVPLSERKSPIPDNWADFLLPPQAGRRSRLSSLGSEAGSIGGGRSPSPSHMLLETSFCGSQPIDDPGFAEPNVPISVARKMSGISLGDLSPLVPRSEFGATSSLHHFRASIQASVHSDYGVEGRHSGKEGRGFNPHHHRSASEYSTRSAPPAPPRRNLNPFGMDLGMKSNRSSLVSQERSPPDSPS